MRLDDINSKMLQTQLAHLGADSSWRCSINFTNCDSNHTYVYAYKYIESVRSILTIIGYGNSITEAISNAHRDDVINYVSLYRQATSKEIVDTISVPPVTADIITENIKHLLINNNNCSAMIAMMIANAINAWYRYTQASDEADFTRLGKCIVLAIEDAKRAGDI
jgi:hypothetical protein